MTQEDPLALAKEMGIALTEADFKKPAGELSDDELDAVAGGADCYCAVGGGTGDSNDKTCACVLGGWGDVKEAGAGYKNGTARCMCGVAGWGVDS